jgi:putative serine protease PepD
MSSPATARKPGRPAREAHLPWTVLGSLLAATLLAGCATGPAPARPAGRATVTATAGPAAAVQQAFVRVIGQVLPSVVEIRSGSGLGSGVVLDAQGDIVTNAHVVAGASSLQVLAAPGAGSGPAAQSPADRALPAVLVGSCPADDLAVVRVSAAAGLPPATFAAPASLVVGDIVLAIGSPLGLGGTVTEGIVSAVGRSVAEPASAGAPAAVLADVIQTSAAINPGNSGGALVGINGAVVGIPTLAAVNRDAGGAAPGIGFAIPASTAVRIGRDLARAGGRGAETALNGCHR